MPLLMDKILTLFAMPLGMAIGTGLFALIALALGWRYVAGGLLAFAIVWLWGWSTPIASQTLSSSLTNRYPFKRVEEMPAADAIVLLSNVLSYPAFPAYPDLTEASDRTWYAARLYQAGKAPLVVVSGGTVWGDPNGRSAAEAARIVLNQFGVPDDALVMEKRSRNTRQNALFTAELAADRGIGRVLLTTSAFHMPRAEAAFRRAGLDVIPAATDYRPHPPGAKTKMRPFILSFLPNARSLSKSSRSLKEYFGFLVYRLRGWV